MLKIGSYIGYGIIILTGIILGLIYSFAPTIMPYHLKAAGSSWENLSNGSQWMFLNFQRSVAAGFISSSIALLFLIIFPFRKKELWSYIAIFTVAFSQLGNITLRTYSVSQNTAANPPVSGLLILLGISITSFILSLISYKKGKLS